MIRTEPTQTKARGAVPSRAPEISSRAARTPSPEVSVIVPTYNEAENIVDLVLFIDRALTKRDIARFEIVVVDDDSPDGTAAVAGRTGRRTRVLNRRGRRRGLSASVIDGFAAARGGIIAVMDADLSRPPEALPELIRAVRDGFPLAVGSRYVPGGGIEEWSTPRRWISRAACLLARPLTPIRDATSGFFAFRRSIVEGIALDPRGFKIGLDLFVKGRHGTRIKEVPYVFRDRSRGDSKFGVAPAYCYLRQLASLRFHSWLS